MSEETNVEAVEAVETVAPEVSAESNDSVEVSADVSDENSEIEVSEEISEENVEVKAETEAELEEEIKDAIEDGASEEDVKEMIRKFTLKVNGKEFIKEIDLSDEETLKKELQLAHAGRQSMQELAELKKTYNAELQRLLEDPFAVLKELNPEFDPVKLSASQIEKYLKEQEMSPEEKAEIEKQRLLEEALAERDKLKKDIEERERQEQMSVLEQEIESDIMSAIDGDEELIADADTVALVAENLLWAAENGYEDMTAKDVLPTVKAQLEEQFRKATTRFKSTAALKKYLGEDLLGKLREERVEKLQKQVNSVNNIKTSTKTIEPEVKPVKKIPLSELFK